MIDVLNNFMEPENRDDDVDQGITGLAQYFDDLFTEIEMELYPKCTKFSSWIFWWSWCIWRYPISGLISPLIYFLNYWKIHYLRGINCQYHTMMPRRRWQSWVWGTSQFMYANTTMSYSRKNTQIKCVSSWIKVARGRKYLAKFFVILH